MSEKTSNLAAPRLEALSNRASILFARAVTLNFSLMQEQGINRAFIHNAASLLLEAVEVSKEITSVEVDAADLSTNPLHADLVEQALVTTTAIRATMDIGWPWLQSLLNSLMIMRQRLQVSSTASIAQRILDQPLLVIDRSEMKEEAVAESKEMKGEEEKALSSPSSTASLPELEPLSPSP